MIPLADRRSFLVSFAITALVLAAGFVHLPVGQASAVMTSLKSREPNAIEREAGGGGYYESLISGGARSDGSRSELDLRLSGKPHRWVHFHDLKATDYRPDTFIQFELKPGVRQPVFDHEFTTNDLGIRDREGYSPEKPPGVFRIALLGSSIDMGWGVPVDFTYENLLEEWLNRESVRRGLDRRFEVMNFAMAAYGPAQRLESFRTKARAFQPDMVLYSVTMLDTRLAQIHLCELLAHRVDPTYAFVREALGRASITNADMAVDPKTHQLASKDRVKAKLAPQLWPMADDVVRELAAECRGQGIDVAMLVVPRVGLADAPAARAASVARHLAIGARHAVPVVNLAGTFDDEDPLRLEIAPWDDHPNAEGHRLLFITLARSLLKDRGLSTRLFGASAAPHDLADIDDPTTR